MNFKKFYNLFLENESKGYGPVYHGGKWDGISPIKMDKGALGTGAYFTPNKERALGYANESGKGSRVIEAYLDVKNPLTLKIDSYDAFVHPCIQALEILGMPKEKAEKLVEKVEEEKGYLGKEISSRAIPQGYDCIFYYYEGELKEIVIWNSDKVINKL
jgi:hypothetical protein